MQVIDVLDQYLSWMEYEKSLLPTGLSLIGSIAEKRKFWVSKFRMMIENASTSIA